jgi:hypothetical protein
MSEMKKTKRTAADMKTKPLLFPSSSIWEFTIDFVILP